MGKGIDLCSMPFLRIEKKKSGTYLRILESYRNEEGKPTHRILHSLGKAEDYSSEQLRGIGIRFYELGGGEIRSLIKGELTEIGRYNYGFQQIYSRAIQHYGLHDIFRRIQRKSRFSFNLYDVVFLMLIERLQDPCSKRKNFEHQNEYINLPKVELHHIYRALDVLAKNNKLIQRQIYQTGRDLFNNKIDVVFYDVTTFYFDSDIEEQEAIRQKGFSKDGKVGKTQVLFSMMIDKDKNPIAYRTFKGNVGEGTTFEHAIAELKSTYQIDKVIIVADRGMLSKSNLDKIVKANYEFILGERLKSLPKAIQQTLLDRSQYDQEWAYTDHDDKPVRITYTTTSYENRTIICTHSQRRADKDKIDREQRIEKAKILLTKPSALKSKSSRFYIRDTAQNTYELDEEKIKKHQAYDGLLAISTNAKDIGISQILEQYKQLYKIEQSFRSLKSHLEIRPMFHWTESRIEGHICMCYIAFTLQNWVLNTVNKSKTQLSENTLRKLLSKMQLSLLQNGKEMIYVRSKPQEKEVFVQQKLGIKPLRPMIPQNKLQI